MKCLKKFCSDNMWIDFLAKMRFIDLKNLSMSEDN